MKQGGWSFNEKWLSMYGDRCVGVGSLPGSLRGEGGRLIDMMIMVHVVESFATNVPG